VVVESISIGLVVCNDTHESVVAACGLLGDDASRATMSWIMVIGKVNLSAWRSVWLFAVNRHMGQRLVSSRLGLGSPMRTVVERLSLVYSIEHRLSDVFPSECVGRQVRVIASFNMERGMPAR